LPAHDATQLAAPEQEDRLDRAAAFADLTRLAAHICGAPIALIHLGADDRADLKAYHGPESAAAEAKRLACAYSAGATDLVVMPDLHNAPQPGAALRFYAGAPLRSADGQPLGALSVLDEQPRSLSVAQLDALQMLGRQALAQLELQRRAAYDEQQRLDSAMLAAVECLVIALDRRGRIVRLNHASERVTGYTLDEIRDRPIWDVLLSSSEAAQVQAEFAQIQPDALPRMIERTWIMKNGRMQRIAWTTSPLLDERGAISHIICASSSLPERRQRPATLQREQTFLTAMLDNLEDGIVACDAEGVVTLFNRATREFYGLPAEPIPAARWDEHFSLYQADGRTPLPIEQTPLYRALQGEHVRNVEMVVAPHSGPARTLIANGQPIVDASGAKLGAVVAMHNITERKQAEQARRASEERLRMLISNAPVMLFAIDMNGIYTMSDGKGLQLHNLKPGQLVGSSIFDLYSAYPQGLVDVRRALAGESFQTTRTVEAFTFDTWYEPLYDEQGALCGVLGIVIDVSERQRAAQEQTRLQEEVIRMQAATLAELSTPLIPLNDQIVVMPLVGGLDTHRVQQVLDTLLSGVQNSRAQVAIIDITGVPVVDTQVANTLLQAAQAVKLLGARVVLTGIRPEVAQTLVGLGVNLGHIVTRGTLQSGISYATQQR
jgi:PAS domain S-box-containing protein